jgi:hypothetical protein
MIAGRSSFGESWLLTLHHNPEVNRNTWHAYGYPAKSRGQVRVTVGDDLRRLPPGAGRLSGGESWLPADSGHMQLQ